LAFRQAYFLAGTDEGGVRVISHEAIEIGQVCLGYGVSLNPGTDTPAVHDHQDQGLDI
jgi:hypothetical protein